MNKVKTPKPKLDGYFMVIDADGIPKFDEPETVPKSVADTIPVEVLRKMDPGIVRTLGLGHKLEEE